MELRRPTSYPPTICSSLIWRETSLILREALIWEISITVILTDLT